MHEKPFFSIVTPAGNHRNGAGKAFHHRHRKAFIPKRRIQNGLRVPNQFQCPDMIRKSKATHMGKDLCEAELSGT